MVTENSSKNKLIAKNAVALYVRTIVTIAISFYTSRVVLKALGVSDFGIFNLVAGFISLINVVTSSLGSATSRFLTFALGENDMAKLKFTFSTALTIHVLLALIFLFVAETAGLWFVNTQLVIPEDRMVAANWAYQAAIVSTMLEITQVPYNSSINSHERMSSYAYIQIVNTLFKLIIALLVLYAVSVDHLIVYSILYMAVSVGVILYYRYYCVKNFEECRVSKSFDKGLFKEMVSYSGWNMYSSICFAFYTQGINVMANRFVGTVLNAAVGVANQVSGILMAFTRNLIAAFNPQVIKEFAAKNYDRVNYLIMMGTKFTTAMFLLCTVPLIFSMEFLMNLWLDEVPVGSVDITNIYILSNFFLCFNPFIYASIHASGKVKKMNLIVGVQQLVCLLIAYLAIKFIHSYTLMFMTCVFSNFVSNVVYLVLLKSLMKDFDLRSFIFGVYLPMSFIAALGLLIAYMLHMLNLYPLIQLVLSVIICDSFIAIVIYRFLLDKNVRDKIKGFVLAKVSNIF